MPAAGEDGCSRERDAVDLMVTMPLRCLIVDDSGVFLDAARAALGREGIHVVGVASTGAQAVERTDELQPDVVLVDLGLGDESGFEVARELARDDAGGSPEVILMSTWAADDVMDLVAASPAVGFLSKTRLSASAIQDLLSAGRAGAS